MAAGAPTASWTSASCFITSAVSASVRPGHSGSVTMRIRCPACPPAKVPRASVIRAGLRPSSFISATASRQPAASAAARTCDPRWPGSATNTGSEQASPSPMKARTCSRYSPVSRYGNARWLRPSPPGGTGGVPASAPGGRGGPRPSSTIRQIPRYGVPMRGGQRHRFSIRLAAFCCSGVLTVQGVRVEGLGLSSRRHGQVVVVAVRGELDAVTSREFDEYLTTARQQSDHVILDLTAVDFMDTSSLAVIVGHWKKLTARDGILALAGARYRYTKTLWITGLADRLPRYDTLEQAIAALADGSGDG